MGVDTERFIKPVPEKLLCAKCENVLVKPKQWKLCSLMICRECLEEMSESPCNCGSQYISSNKFLINKLKSLVLKCRYYPEGCNFTAKFGEISKHEVGCHFQNSTMAISNRDPFTATNKSKTQGPPKQLKPVADYRDLPEAISPFAEKTYFITCRKGCNKQILTKKEFESHRWVDHLKNVIRDQKREREMLDEHLEEAEKDVKDLLMEFERCKENQETVIDELKEKLMFLEKRNDSLKMERMRRTKDYEERLNEEKVKSEKDSTLAFMNFIQTAEKDFTLFCSRLNKDFGKYKEKLKDEATTYQLKTKANLMAKETDGIKKHTKSKSISTTPKSGTKTKSRFK